MLFSLTNLANFDVKASSSAVIYVSSGCWKLYMKLSLVSRRKKVRNLFCFSLPYELMSSLHCFSSLTLRWYARRMSDWKSARNSLFSPSADSSPTAVSQSPLASRASRIASSSPIPYRLTRASLMLSASIFFTSIRCTRLRMVSRSLSGSSLTKMKMVCEGGSSISLSILFEHSMFILSGNQIIDTLYPP